MKDLARVEFAKFKQLEKVEIPDLYNILIQKQVYEAKTIEAREGILNNIYNEITREA